MIRLNLLKEQENAGSSLSSEAEGIMFFSLAEKQPAPLNLRQMAISSSSASSIYRKIRDDERDDEVLPIELILKRHGLEQVSATTFRKPDYLRR